MLNIKKKIKIVRDSSDEVTVETTDGVETWTIPHVMDTTYLTHGYFRYIGKFPPQIASKLISEFYPGKGTILDPMVGGGTVLTEAVLRGIECEGWDVNPVSLLISRCVTRHVEQEALKETSKQLLSGLRILGGEETLFDGQIEGWRRKGLDLKYCSEYFDEKAKTELEFALHHIHSISLKHRAVSELLLVFVLSSLRRISFANVKKMNLELDPTKKSRSTLLKELSSRLLSSEAVNSSLPDEFGRHLATIYERDVTQWTPQKKYGMIVMHPPYLTNTAFSESTQLQLALLDINHKDIWKKELRCRGSFLHEPDGLKKYLVNWAKMTQTAAASLLKGGRLAIVIGDGNIDYVRIPVGAISIEFGIDAGLRLIKRGFHILNNQTGQTQNKKMKGQHVIVFEKP